jgi:hypothetical protein
MNATDPFDNDWARVASVPSRNFRSVPFNEIVYQAGSWDLPEEWDLVVRVENDETGAVVERAFRTSAAASFFIEQASEAGLEITYYNDQTMASTYPSTAET